jgi:uncharacterized NAD(P)/FAD-binding protein YdhS
MTVFPVTPAKSIAVIGAGFSGSLLSVALRAICPHGTQIHLIERSGRFGPGLAYSPPDHAHLLNVPTGRISAFPDQPLDFLHWLQARSPSREGGFVSRALYGAYLADIVRNCPGLHLWHDQVVAVQFSGARTHLVCRSGRTLMADVGVLAMGNDAPLPPCDVSGLEAAGIWRPDPWSSDSFAALDPTATVLLVGTGLTMVDAVVSMLETGHRGRIHAVSRRGLLPQSHLETPAPVPPCPLPLPIEIGVLMPFIRQQIAAAGAWQPVIDSLRPHTQALWRAMGPVEQARFLRHVRAWWDVHRHRMAPEIARRIAEVRSSGQLTIHAGRIVGYEPDGEVIVQRRGGRTIERIAAARVVNCTGPGGDVSRSEDPLVRSLLHEGVARPDPLRLGFDVTEACEIVARDGSVSGRLFAIGPLTKGGWWEITAVPDIRRQCQSVAQTIAALTGPHGAVASAETLRTLAAAMQ